MPRPSIESLFDATIICDADGRIQRFSASAEATFGRTAADVIGLPLTELVPRFYAHGPEGRWRTPAVHGDGDLFPIEVAAWDEEHARTVVLVRDLRAYDLQGTAAEDGGWWEIDPVTLDALWSPRTYELHGVDPKTFDPSVESVLAIIESADRAVVDSAVQTMLAGEATQSFEYRLASYEGGPRILEATLLSDPDVNRIHGVCRDVTERRLTRARLEVHQAVANALDEWEHATSDLRGLLQRLYLVTGWHIGVLWVPRGDVMVCRAFICETGMEVPGFEKLVRSMRPRRDQDTLVGRVWSSGTAHAHADITETNLTRAAVAGAEGIRGAMAMPATNGDELLAVVEFFSADRRDLEAEMLDTLEAVGRQLGTFLSTRRGLLAPAVLTPREREILLLASRGQGVREIAETLCVSSATVKTHFQNLYGKLGVNDRPAAVAHALRTGMIS